MGDVKHSEIVNHISLDLLMLITWQMSIRQQHQIMGYLLLYGIKIRTRADNGSAYRNSLPNLTVEGVEFT